MRERILAPLQMNRLRRLLGAADRRESSAWPHARVSTDVRGRDGPLSALPGQTNLDVAAAAGALNANSADVARWLECSSVADWTRAPTSASTAKAQAREMWTPQTLIPDSRRTRRRSSWRKRTSAPTRLGWIVSDYRGQLMLAHGGGVPGSAALFVIVPEKHVAFAMMTNSEEAGWAVSRCSTDCSITISAREPGLDRRRRRTLRAASIAKGKEAMAASPQLRQAQDTGQPPLPTERYAGRYRGCLVRVLSTIAQAGDGLNIALRSHPCDVRQARARALRHVPHALDGSLDRRCVRHVRAEAGRLDRDAMTMRAISPLADFSYDYQDLLFRPSAAH